MAVKGTTSYCGYPVDPEIISCPICHEAMKEVRVEQERPVRELLKLGRGGFLEEPTLRGITEIYSLVLTMECPRCRAELNIPMEIEQYTPSVTRDKDGFIVHNF